MEILPQFVGRGECIYFLELLFHAVSYERYSYIWFYMYIYSYRCPYKYYYILIIVLLKQLLFLCVLCIIILLLCKLCIHSFMHWKSGSGNFLVLMLFVLEYTDYEWMFGVTFCRRHFQKKIFVFKHRIRSPKVHLTNSQHWFSEGLGAEDRPLSEAMRT